MMTTEEFFTEAKRLNLRMLGTPEETRAALDSKDAEIERLKAAIAKAYGYLWCVNCEPGTPRQYPPERAAYAARKELRDLLTKEQRGAAINAAVQEVHETVRTESIQGAQPNGKLSRPQGGVSLTNVLCLAATTARHSENTRSRGHRPGRFETEQGRRPCG